MKNGTCCYFDEIININDFDLDNDLLDEPSHGNVLIYDIAYKTPQSLHINFDKVDINIRKHDGTKFVALFCFNGKYDRFRRIITLK